MVEIKGNIKPETAVNESTEYGKKYLQPKKEQIMVETNESKKAEALWQTLRLSFVSYDELLFLLFIFCAD